MKSWTRVEPDEYRLLNKHFTRGRGGHHIKYIVLHHNAANLSIAQCWNVWQTRQASAHYQVQADGRIGQLVEDSNTAWHAGNYLANCQSIGIEHADISTSPWSISAATLDNGAHLVAALCRAYNLGPPQWNVNVFAHSYFSATACPASLASSQRDEYMHKAQQYYNNLEGNTTMTSSTDIWIHPIGEKGDGNTNNVPAWIRLSWVDWNTTQLRNELLRHDDGHQGDGSSAGIYDRICYIDSQVRDLKKELATLNAKLDTIITSLTSDPVADGKHINIADQVKNAIESVNVILSVKGQ